MSSVGVTRAASAGLSAIQAFLPRIWGIVRQVFHEVMGLVFLVLAAFFAVGAHGFLQTYRRLDENPDELPKLILVGVFVALFAAFGVSSFLRARRVSRGR